MGVEQVDDRPQVQDAEEGWCGVDGLIGDVRQPQQGTETGVTASPGEHPPVAAVNDLDRAAAVQGPARLAGDGQAAEAGPYGPGHGLDVMALGHPVLVHRRAVVPTAVTGTLRVELMPLVIPEPELVAHVDDGHPSKPKARA